MLDALESLHKMGFVHRDVKIENFRINSDDNLANIVDFGLTKPYKSDDR